ncbi:MAG TPA: elongation factor Ts [Candidatus Pacearchaeota archaeon]|nr:elongation factor Ts [Candidatus Pacearchaeota archaeon]HOK94440.1 elongation factor Ts [Candidatus Pacearchaeota archaeon]HPO75506.1 elongation factor Ts [Candidatus Pacearchaeota archaeon]
MAANIDQIKKLRQLTNISIQECKKALEEANGDLEKAQEILKKKGAEVVEKKKERQTKEGIIGVYLHQNKKIGAMVKVSCESDFVERNEIFQDLVHNLAMQIAAMNPKDVEELLNQVYIKDIKKTIKQFIDEAVMKLGENIKVEEFYRMEI